MAEPTEAAVDRDRRPLVSIAGHVVRRPRGPRRYFDDITAGHALYPLLILFGLNAVDELDRTVFGVLGPEIRDSFGLTNQGYLTLIALTLLGGLLLEVPLAYYADRLHRVRIAVLGAAVWSLFGLFTGFATTILLLVIARSGAGMGRAVVTPTHNSLLSDYYPVEVRTDVFGFHRMANALGAFLGPVIGGLLAEAFGWRVPFFVFVIPSIVFVLLGLRLREPGRGHHERRAAGASEEVIATDEQPPSWAESVRILWQIRTLRRIWYSLPFLAASVIGLASLTAIYYEEVFNLSESQRGFVAGVAEPAQIVGILLGIPLASRLMLRDPGLGLRLLSIVAVGIAGAWVAFALAPVLAVAIIANILISGLAALLAPGHLRFAVAGDPAEGSIARVLHGVPVHPAGADRALHRRWDRRSLRHPAGHVAHGPDLPDRCVHPVVGVVLREVRHQPGVDLHGRSGGGALPALEGRGEAPARAQRRRELRQRPGALRRELRDRRGRDRRAAGHERRREVHAC